MTPGITFNSGCLWLSDRITRRDLDRFFDSIGERQRPAPTPKPRPAYRLKNSVGTIPVTPLAPDRHPW